MGNYAYHTKGRENEKHYFDIQGHGERLQNSRRSSKILEGGKMKKFLRAMEWEKRGGGKIVITVPVLAVDFDEKSGKVCLLHTDSSKTHIDTNKDKVIIKKDKKIIQILKGSRNENIEQRI
ncbi:MAG TPA: hypothetical protein CFH81_02300 [Sulfurovum sp. UBA12169]|nr:MAG TPA: hypothetical protein CFH81_02300 [Sulfurovum sp. UBA12169]